MAHENALKRHAHNEEARLLQATRRAQGAAKLLEQQAKALEAQLGKRTARLSKAAQSMPVWADKPLGMYDSSLMRGA